MCLADHCSLLVIMDSTFWWVWSSLCVMKSRDNSCLAGCQVEAFFLFCFFLSSLGSCYLQYYLSLASAWLQSHWETCRSKYSAFLMFLFTLADLVDTYFPWPLWIYTGICRFSVWCGSWFLVLVKPLQCLIVLPLWYDFSDFETFVGWNGKLFLKCSVVNPWS